MSNKRRKKKKWAKKQRKAMRQKLQPQETNTQTPKPRKRKVNIKRKIRRKLPKLPLKLLALVTVVAFGLLFWAVSSSNEGVLADETQEVAQTTSAQTGEVVIQRVTYRVAGQPVAVRVSGDPNPDNNGLFYLHTDHQGSIVAVSDEDGNPVEDISRFYPYGERRSGVSSEITDRGYTGHQHNDDLGLIYMNSRYYAPGIGRFVSSDTLVPDLTDPQAWNRYSYVRNNPINLIDPSGHCWGPASFIRGWTALGYDTTCNNLDQALGIMQHPDASFGEKVAAGSYVITEGAAHTALALGTAGVVCSTGAGCAALVEPALGAGTVACADGDCTNEAQLIANTANTLCSDGDCTNELGAASQISTQAQYYLQSLPNSGSSIAVSRGDITSQIMAELQQVTGNEFALARLSDGSRVLIRGTANSVVLPENTVRLIAHTHPGLQVAPSYADLTTLQALQQKWSLIISENNSWFKFFADWLEE